MTTHESLQTGWLMVIAGWLMLGIGWLVPEQPIGLAIMAGGLLVVLVAFGVVMQA